MDVSVIIVNYNTKDFLASCLTSLFEKTRGISYEVIVSDNGSTDGSIEMLQEKFSHVILIENKRNLGFGAANNKALAVAKGKYVFYLNSDTVLLNNAVKLFYDYFESYSEKKLGALGGMLLDEKGNYIHSYGDFPRYKASIIDLLKLNAGNIYLSLGTLLGIKTMHRNHFSDEYYGAVAFVTGADLFVRNTPLAKYDEDFFLYSEDSFLQFVMAQHNLERRIIQGPKIVHCCGGSVGERISIYRKASYSRICFEFSRIIFLKKIDRQKNFLSLLLLFFIKFLILLSWSNFFLIKKTCHYFKKLLIL
ncbi:MAG: glycosyltransferase family 2 protein [Treponema sp.]|nr:glycosyltransferase family 2 protein [Treponema sp.]